MLNNQQKIAVCFFGQVKNYTNLLYKNFYNCIISPISSYVDSLDYYLVTYDNLHIYNPANNEDHDIDFTSIYQYINFNQTNIISVDSSEVRNIDIFSQSLVDRFGGSWGKWSDISTKFAIRQLYSLHILYSIIPKVYNRYLLLRPDIIYSNPLQSDILNYEYDMLVPKFDSWFGYNDRFAILTNNGLDTYTSRYNEIINKPEKYHSEKYLKQICDNKKISVKEFDNFIFKRVRCDGSTQ